MSNDKIIAYKAFNKDFTCRDFQFKIGETYKHEGSVKACSSGFHSCEYPLDIFNYYNPCSSSFAMVEASGLIDKENSDSKLASEYLTVVKELNLRELVEAAIKYTMERCVADGSQHSTGYQAASTATGYQAASTATGDRAASTATGHRAASTATGHRAASTATGDQAASTATGDRAASTATGYRAASTATGHQAASTATGYQAASLTTGNYSSSKVVLQEGETVSNCSAVATGHNSKVLAPIGAAIFLVERDDEGRIIHVFSGIVGKKKIKPDTWYTLKGGKLTVVEE